MYERCLQSELSTSVFRLFEHERRHDYKSRNAFFSSYKCLLSAIRFRENT